MRGIVSEMQLIQGTGVEKRRLLTASEARVLGTAIRISDSTEVGQCENEQKFMVLTSSMWRTHGWGRDSEHGSRGRVMLSWASSS